MGKLTQDFRPGLYYTAPAGLRWLQQVDYAFGKAEAATGGPALGNNGSERFQDIRRESARSARGCD